VEKYRLSNISLENFQIPSTKFQTIRFRYSVIEIYLGFENWTPTLPPPEGPAKREGEGRVASQASLGPHLEFKVMYVDVGI